MTDFDDLLELSNELNNLRKALYLLEWDERTYLPEGAVNGRSETKAELSKMHHNTLTSDKMKKTLEDLEKKKDSLNEEQRAAVREMKRDFERKYKIPDSLVEEMSKTSTKAQKAWEKARNNSDFEEFLPHLKKQVELKKEMAEHVGYENEPYDVLIDEYEPGFTAKKVKSIFDPMKKKLSGVVDGILDTDYEPGEGVFEGKTFSIKKQKELGREIAESFGYDFSHGRLDETVHPFTIGMDDDVRITNRFTEKNLSSLFSLMHETGHALYEQGLPEEWFGHPLGQRISMGYHESQSRLWENFVGRNENFMSYLFPKLVDKFPQLEDHSRREFYERMNRVEPSFIRVEADEVTYNLHIALRFDIELGLFRGDIEPEETEVIWQNKMDDYLGIVPEDPAKGVLQDIHWSAGQFGYFPSYALGNLYAAQIFDTASSSIDGLKQNLENGEFGPLLDWLRDNIHRHGRKYRASEMTERVTGEDLNEDYYIDYLKDKYDPIYGI